MKHSFLFKFIAVVLCAASLTCAVGSGLGIFTMTEGGLYNRTVDEMIEEQIQRQGAGIAQNLAARYASTWLGQVPTQLVTEYFPLHSSNLLGGTYGYSILDSEGNEIDGIPSSDPDNAKAYRFPITGQYLHLVSLMSQEEKFPGHQSDPDSYTNAIWEGDLYVYEAVPPEGAVFSSVFFTLTDGSAYEFSDGTGLGSAYYLPDGHLTCLFMDPGIQLPSNISVTEIMLVGSNGELLYEASCPTGVGYFTNNGNSIFISTVLGKSEPEETVPETEAATEPETVPETVPETTEATVPPTTEPPVVIEVEDNLPDEGIVEVMELKATLRKGDKVSHVDEYGIGRIHHDGEGNIEFTSYEHWETEIGKVVYILFLDNEGEVLYEATCDEGVGKLYLDDQDRIAYKSELPEIPPETVPETTVETVPETTVETMPETTEVVETTALETVPETTEPIMINGKPLMEYDVHTAEYVDPQTQKTMYADFVYTPMPEYTVELYLTEDSMNYAQVYQVLRLVRAYRDYLLPALGISILLFILTGIYLICAAGHKPKTDLIQAGGLNRIPLDLYLLIVGIGIPIFCIAIAEGSVYLLQQNLAVGCACAAACTFAASMICVGFLFAAVAQFKTPDGFWWRNTLCGHSIRLCFRFGSYLEKWCRQSLFPLLGSATQKLWAVVCIVLVWLYRKTEQFFLWAGRNTGKFLSWLGGVIHRFLSLLPLTWQWLACGFLMFLMVALVFAANGEEVLVVFCLCGSISLIVYGAHCFGTLLESTKKMRKGGLDTKVDDKMMVGAFKEFAGELNELAGVAVVAAQKQLNSERMKSELITNVSHDIKTPLTSIINYVDLLQRPHTYEEGEEYLDVLNRQSQQLKKLLEDLMDMSKASTGNINVEITQVDAVEFINQALGEFSDKLERARLTPVFRYTEPYVPMMADGRLVWRVLNNLLGNAVKYAMPGTRLYLDLMTLDNTVVISLKNISREELNIDADELMERFVRGDGSRNTEGSGLGLNIAKSLMELQKGQMQLLVDGDLFKVTLIFPAE